MPESRARDDEVIGKRYFSDSIAETSSLRSIGPLLHEHPEIVWPKTFIDFRFYWGRLTIRKVTRREKRLRWRECGCIMTKNCSAKIVLRKSSADCFCKRSLIARFRNKVLQRRFLQSTVFSWKTIGRWSWDCFNTKKIAFLIRRLSDRLLPNASSIFLFRNFLLNFWE